MARKKKPTRKYKPRNEFRMANSKQTGYHPQYIFGETSTRYKSFGLTQHPDDKHRYYRLTKNPEPGNSNKAFLKLEKHSLQKKYYGDPLEGWRFDKSDMPIVRYQTKEYKKSTNRKPKWWYVNKRRWNKKKK